jgi:hypothetical protein
MEIESSFRKMKNFVSLNLTLHAALGSTCCLGQHGAGVLDIIHPARVHGCCLMPAAGDQIDPILELGGLFRLPIRLTMNSTNARFSAFDRVTRMDRDYSTSFLIYFGENLCTLKLFLESIISLGEA